MIRINLICDRASRAALLASLVSQRLITGSAFQSSDENLCAYCEKDCTGFSVFVTNLLQHVGTLPEAITSRQFFFWELLLLQALREDFAERVLTFLARAESKTTDPWQADDYRVAWLTVLYAARGHANPWEFAFWGYYGKTLSKALIAWAERDAQTAIELERCSLPPKKPSASEQRRRRTA